jgi:hypothetical protein
MDLLDQLEVDRPRSVRGGDRLQPAQDVLPAVLNLLSGCERIVVELGGCLERSRHDALDRSLAT